MRIKSRTDLTSSSREHSYSHLVLLHPTLTLQYTPASITIGIDVFYYKDPKLHDARVVIIMCLKRAIYCPEQRRAAFFSWFYETHFDSWQHYNFLKKYILKKVT